jgi:hypothetical protein
LKDRALPVWFRILLILVALSQVVFGATLMLNPAAIGSVWPWQLTTITTRILAASTLVSVPLEIVPAIVNRWSVTRIPIVMLLTYRIFQLLAGVIHLNRFDFSRPVTWNYFGGGTFMLVVLVYVLVRGGLGEQTISGMPDWLRGNASLVLGPAGVATLRLLGLFFAGLGISFLILGANAAPLWFEAAGKLTPLTARLFASPTIGLALALWLITLAPYWREIAIPAIGMSTFGLIATVSLILEAPSIAPPTSFGYVTASVPIILLVIGLFLLLPSRSSVPVGTTTRGIAT